MPCASASTNTYNIMVGFALMPAEFIVVMIAQPARRH
jgi:hypothetical protein